MTFARLILVALTTISLTICTNAVAGKPGGKYRNQTIQSTQFDGRKLRLQHQDSHFNSAQYRSLQHQQSFAKPQVWSQHSEPTSNQKLRATQFTKLPRLGFSSQFGSVQGQTGEYVTQVNYGSTADKLGLKQRDMILAVNGKTLRTQNCWNKHLQQATNHDGWVTLKIRDSRTGNIAYQTANLLKN